MTTPRTAAGRALLAHEANAGIWHTVDGRRTEMTAAILAIEAEAEAAPAGGLREALDALIWDAIGENEGCSHHYGNLTYSCSCAVPVEAVQAALTASPSAPTLDVERRLIVARFIAEHWRDFYMKEHAKGERGYWAIGTHPLALVLAALDGETNPHELGLTDSAGAALAERTAAAYSEEGA